MMWVRAGGRWRNRREVAAGEGSASPLCLRFELWRLACAHGLWGCGCEQYGVEVIAWVSAVGNVACSREYETDRYHLPTSASASASATATATASSVLSRSQIDASAVRCPDPTAAQRMSAVILAARNAQDSVGGVITCVVRPITIEEKGKHDAAQAGRLQRAAQSLLLPVGWGEPVFDKLEAGLAHAMLSIPATKGFEIGSGFDGAKMMGSAHNDPFVALPTAPAATDPAQSSAGGGLKRKAATADSPQASSTTSSHASDAITAASAPKKLKLEHSQAPHSASAAPASASPVFPLLATATNHSGGVQAGVSNGACIVFRVAFKPPATIGRAQHSVDFSGQPITLEAAGRHDPCVVPRAVPIVEVSQRYPRVPDAGLCLICNRRFTVGDGSPCAG
jgi:chorismate synthase